MTVEQSTSMATLAEALRRVGCPVPFVSPQMLLYAGQTRYATLEWLFGSLLKDKGSVNLGQNGPQDEQAQAQRLAEAAHFLHFTPSADEELIQGSGSVSDRVSFLLELIECVDAALNPAKDSWSIEEQADRDLQLLESICEQRQQVFSDECQLFPRDVASSGGHLPDEHALDMQLRRCLEELHKMQASLEHLPVQEKAGDATADRSQVSTDLQSALDTFLDHAQSFDLVYKSGIEHWAKAVKRPEVQSFGADSHQILESYTNLQKLHTSLHHIRKASSTLQDAKSLDRTKDDAGNSDTISSSGATQAALEQLVKDVEGAVVELDDGLRILEGSGNFPRG